MSPLMNTPGIRDFRTWLVVNHQCDMKACSKDHVLRCDSPFTLLPITHCLAERIAIAGAAIDTLKYIPMWPRQLGIGTAKERVHRSDVSG